MRYSIFLDQRNAYVDFDENLSSAELSIVQDVLIKAIETRKKEIKKLEAMQLGPMDAIEKIYPPLSLRTVNCLQRAGMKTIGDVLSHTLEEISQIRNLGNKSYQEIQDRFKAYGKFREASDE